MLIESEARWYALSASLIVVIVWEYLAPARESVAITIRARWPVNFALGALGVGLMYFLGEALSGPLRGFVGRVTPLGAHLTALPTWFALVVTVVVADLAYYVLHVLQHRSSLLWRFHRVHHADLEYDFTTSFRFHPIEVPVTAVILGTVVAILGAPSEAILAYVLIRQTSDAIGHGNVSVPRWIDRAARIVLITPNVHRIHHSTERDETDSNFGGLLTLWDRLFGTYRAEPLLGPGTMTIGLQELRDPSDQTLARLLSVPFDHGPRPR